ncbi:MAG: glutamine-hydrolyzing carbamoyl-phosphate synthase small subunit [Gammaproteobacteria bacterium]|nr:glutamine-hydrolyzing carbamoyl-phosphate synthase small subunit [Gammaproteobacteria bacterium]MBT4462937.1 glutamine-hydrolyzing carbamoyl-phosphate synthase small subunit [Gammaproteobacteria bacterium]MBT4654640.1 glutamine-hydrolyzing carbamoyl-phosphate synthase small subunit [Gammaproteobacteria bacterium]MBT5117049.1 glutamine-hydrolyzing carbamoyl-phosphate synthase small subunit [Gammaproteobacteria bacterium]MBT5761326.1 glutamine-hydrolyzing carbamoyl-phosphate synthase small sub
MNKSEAVLLLEDGSTFSGYSVGVQGLSVGEVVFNTSMTGYQEILTDPSYDSQIITFTNPHVGNTGVNDEDIESLKIHASGAILRDKEILSNSWRKSNTLQEFLKNANIVAISGIDTRKLTRILRTTGSQNGCIMSGDIDLEIAKKRIEEFDGLDGVDLAKKVTSKSVYEWDEGLANIYQENKVQKKQNIFKVVAYDFGIKHNILRILKDHGCNLTVVPADYDVNKIIEMKPDGVFLSNGPGDPKACSYAISNIKILLDNKIPLFGICLGFQLLALASGSKTIKMKFGHHGANHPVMDLVTRKVFITSQNHGFMVDDKTLLDNIKPTHISLFDNSLQGFEITDKYAFGFQGHPEASPGPQDINLIFEKFTSFMTERKNANK